MESIDGVVSVSMALAQYEARAEMNAELLRRLLASEAAAALQLVAGMQQVAAVAPVSPGRGGLLDATVA